MASRSISRESFSRMLDSEIVKSNKKKTRVVNESMTAGTEGYTDEIYKSVATSDSFHQESIQQDIRSSFGRIGFNNGSIGTHPDFAHLSETEDIEYSYICSLFLDIKNSTRLTFLYELHDVIAIKNTILKAAAETVRAMDGHVHRFMGDALLAFFGGKHQDKDDSVVNAINCASVLEALMTGTIIPVLEQKYYQNPKADYLGFRIGLDYGSDEQIAWASYGFKGVSEVTPTSFYVDVAAKLQGIAGKNKSMLGNNILQDIDFPEEFTNIRTRKQTNKEGDTETIPTPYLPRSYMDSEGKIHKYKVRELNHGKYRDLLPFPTELKESQPNSSVVSCPDISFKCYICTGNTETSYRSVSRALDKNTTLKFKIHLAKSIFNTEKFPLKIKIIKTNYGIEAQLKKNRGVYEMPDIIVQKNPNHMSSFFPGESFPHIDATAYRGLHTMEATVYNSDNTIIFRDIIGVYIR